MRRTLSALILLAVLIAGGCSGGASPAKQKRDFLAKANSICRHFDDLQNNVLFPSVDPIAAGVSHAKRAEWGVSLKQVAYLGTQEVEALRKLEPPAELRDRYQRMVATKDAAYASLLRGADAAKRNRPGALKTAAEAGKAQLERATALAKKLGLRRCQ